MPSNHNALLQWTHTSTAGSFTAEHALGNSSFTILQVHWHEFHGELRMPTCILQTFGPALLSSRQIVLLQTVISNATRWDTFEYLMEQQALPRSEQLFRKRYKKSPSFISIHMGVKVDVLPKVSLYHNRHLTKPLACALLALIFAAAFRFLCMWSAVPVCVVVVTLLAAASLIQISCSGFAGCCNVASATVICY